MKKVITMAAALFITVAASQSVSAQKLSLGAVGSFGHSWTGNTGGDRDFKFSPALGIGMVYSRNEHWAYASELTISHEGFKNDYPAGNGEFQKVTINPVYLRMPMHLVYFFGKFGDKIRPKVFAGPTLGLKIDEKQWVRNDVPNEGSTMTDTDIFRTFDIGINAGAGANFKIARKTWINADLAYTHGLMDAVKDGADPDFNGNRNIHATIGVMWGL